MLNIITGKSIILRPLIDEDADFLFQNVTNPEVRRQLRQLPDPYNIEHAYEFINTVTKEGLNEESYHFGIEEMATGKLAGVIGGRFPDGNKEIAEIGYWLAKASWGKGIATEAVALIVSFLINTVKVKSVTANVFENNIASIRVLEKNGFMNTEPLEEQYCNNLNSAVVLHFERLVQDP